MKIRKTAIYTFFLCVMLLLACNPDKEEKLTPDQPEIEQPDVPVIPPVEEEPETPSIPDDDGGTAGKPGDTPSTKPDDNPSTAPDDNPSTKPDDNLPTDPGDYTESSKVLYERDFTTNVDLRNYQMINADGISINSPVHVGNWHQNINGTNASLSSYMYDPANDHDHWLITEGVYIHVPKVIIAWDMMAELYEEDYEVYISTSREKDSFTERIFAGSLQGGRDIPERQVDYLLEGYEGKTIYLAFRHCTRREKKYILTLNKLTISSFPYDKADLQTDKVWLTYPDYLASNQNLATGTTYPPGLKLKVSMAIKNLGTGIKDGQLTVSYNYQGKEVTETISDVYLMHGATYVHTFKEKLLTTSASPNTLQPVTATVKPLLGEVRLKANSRYIKLTLLNGNPQYRILFEKVSKLNCVPCGQVFHSYDQLDKKYPDRMIGVCTMYDNGLNPPPAFGASYQNMITSIGQIPGTPAGCYDRSGSAYPDLGGLEWIMGHETFASRMFPPFAIQVTHEFSEDKTTMHVHVAATCLLDQEDAQVNITALVLEDNIKEYPNQVGVPNAIHHHIVRTILGDNWRYGLEGVIPTHAKAGETYTHTFTYEVPATFGKHTTDLTQLYAVGALIDRSRGEVINSNKSKKTTTKTTKR